MTFDEWWDTTKATATPETFAGWEASCRQAWNAAAADADDERERLRAEVALLDAGHSSALRTINRLGRPPTPTGWSDTDWIKALAAAKEEGYQECLKIFAAHIHGMASLPRPPRAG